MIGADFNALDGEGRVRASLRFAATSEIPDIGEWVRLEDVEGNSCSAAVEQVRGLAVLARPDWSSWVAGDVARLSRVFGGRRFVTFVSTGRSPDDQLLSR
jgi:hypothetical protein